MNGPFEFNFVPYMQIVGEQVSCTLLSGVGGEHFVETLSTSNTLSCLEFNS